MEHFWAGPALDGGSVTRFLVTILFAAVLAPIGLWGHAGAFVLAKCQTDPAGNLVLELTVDCQQHPVLTDKSTALNALRRVLAVQSPSGPVALDAIALAKIEYPLALDSDLPFPADPTPVGVLTQLVKLSYNWHPNEHLVRFTVPVGVEHDVLFWRGGAAVPNTGAPPWQILIAGDVSPPIAVKTSAAEASPARVWRFLLTLALSLTTLGVVVWRRRRQKASAREKSATP